jgi:hypothetical protein
MKLNTRLALFAAVLLSTLGMNSQALALCGGCGELSILEKKLSALKPNDDNAATPLINKATKAVSKLPTQKGKKLNAEQILAVSRLLSAAFPNDADYSIIDGNLKLFQANEKEFFATFATFPKKDAENLKSELDIKLGEAEGGQDSDPDAEPSAVLLKKK